MLNALCLYVTSYGVLVSRLTRDFIDVLVDSARHGISDQYAHQHN